MHRLVLAISLGLLLVSGLAEAKVVAVPRRGGTACTMEAKMCPDGKTYVSRHGPNCAFSACPDEASPPAAPPAPPEGHTPPDSQGDEGSGSNAKPDDGGAAPAGDPDSDGTDNAGENKQ